MFIHCITEGYTYIQRIYNLIDLATVKQGSRNSSSTLNDVDYIVVFRVINLLNKEARVQKFFIYTEWGSTYSFLCCNYHTFVFNDELLQHSGFYIIWFFFVLIEFFYTFFFYIFLKILKVWHLQHDISG